MSSEIGERLKKLRKTMARTQADMAIMMGMSHKGWQLLESPKSAPSAQTLIKLSELGFNPLWVLTGQSEMLLPVDSSTKNKIQFPLKDISTHSKSILDKDFDDTFEELYGRVIEVLATVYNKMEIKISMRNMGKEAAIKARDIFSSSKNPDEWSAVLNYMALQVEKELSNLVNAGEN